MLVLILGKWALGEGSRGELRSVVNVWPGTLLWEPFACNAVASACVMVPNWARPLRGSATWATIRSWIIQFSYHPDSLLMTFSPAKSATESLPDLTLLGSIALPGGGTLATP